MADVLTTKQLVALDAETRAVVVLARRGIEELWRLDGANDFVHLPMQLLAQGFERLLKLTLALARLERDGRLPTHNEFRRKYNHDLLRLSDDLVALAQLQSAYVERPAVRDDLDFIQYDDELRRLLRLLSTFGTWSRYYRFEEFLGVHTLSPDDDPDREWQDIERKALMAIDGWSDLILKPDGMTQIHCRIAADVTKTLERFARALTRMWTLGAVHSDARRFTGTIGQFLFLNDEDLGRLRK